MKKITMTILIFSLIFFIFNKNLVDAKSIEDIKISKSIVEKGASSFVPDITKEIMNVYGSVENFEKYGGIYFDSEGVVHLDYKKSNIDKGLILNKTIKDSVDNLTEKIIENNTKLVQAISEEIEIENLVLSKSVKYSTADLNDLKEKILANIKDFLVENEFEGISYSLAASFSEQKIILEHKTLPENLIAQLNESFKDVLQVEKTDIIAEPSKGRKESWNQLGAGLGIRVPGDYICSTAGIASKNGNYFIITAGHCFEGTVSTTNSGAIVRQYNDIVGRQHSKGYYGDLDVGLVRITPDISPLTRYATNKVKRWITTDVYDGYYKGSMIAYEGMSICKVGITTNLTCGTVRYANKTIMYDDIPNQNFNVAEIIGAGFSDEGDSGGAAYYTYKEDQLYLVGVVSGHYWQVKDKIRGGYITKYNDIQKLYNIDLYTNNTNTTIK